LALPAHLTALHDWEKAMWTTGLFFISHVYSYLQYYRFVVLFLEFCKFCLNILKCSGAPLIEHCQHA
jgi:hypothetical protein